VVQEFFSGANIAFIVISHYYLTTILDLRQHSSNIVVTSISVQNFTRSGYAKMGASNRRSLICANACCSA